MVVLYERFENEPSKVLNGNYESDEEAVQLPDGYSSLNSSIDANPTENFEKLKTTDEIDRNSSLNVTIQDPSVNNAKSIFNREYVDFMLEYKYPSKMSVGSVIFGGLVSVSLIVLQSVSIYVKAPFYEVGSGIWTGFFMLFIQASIVGLIYRPHHKTVSFIYNMNIFAVIMNLAFNVMLNLLALRDNCLGEKIIYGRQCTERDYGGFNAAMFVLGLANACLGVTFIRKIRLSLAQIQNSMLKNSIPMTDQIFTNPLVNTRLME